MLSIDKSSDPRLALQVIRGLEGEVSHHYALKSKELGEALTQLAISKVVRNYVSDLAVCQAINSVAFYNYSQTPGQSLNYFKNYLETLKVNLNYILSNNSRLQFTFTKLLEAIRSRIIKLDKPRTFTNTRSLQDRVIRLKSIIKLDGSRGRSARVPSTFQRSANSTSQAEGESSTSSQEKTDNTLQQSSSLDTRRSSRRGNQYRGRAYRAPRTKRPTTNKIGKRTYFSYGKSGYILRLYPKASRKNSESLKNENTQL